MFMKIVSTQGRVRFFSKLFGALFAIGCASADPARSDSPSPAATEHANPNVAFETEGKALSRVVGYFPTYRLYKRSSIDSGALTHLNIAFAAPMTGLADAPIDFDSDVFDQLQELTRAAHEKNVKVLGAIGGEKYGHLVTSALSSDADAVVTSTLAFMQRYGFDGIDIDIEGDDIEPNTYEKFVTGLAERLPTGKLLTAAVDSTDEGKYRALDRVAFLNVMSYNQYACDDHHCPHSTYDRAAQDLNHWSSTYGSSNVVLGVPFYGICLGDGCPTVIHRGASQATYDELLTFWKEGNQGPIPDEFQNPDQKYYVSLNGPETIQNKVRLAKDYGGIMVWELGQDVSGADSLFSVIKKNR